MAKQWEVEDIWEIIGYNRTPVVECLSGREVELGQQIPQQSETWEKTGWASPSIYHESHSVRMWTREEACDTTTGTVVWNNQW